MSTIYVDIKLILTTFYEDFDILEKGIQLTLSYLVKSILVSKKANVL
jgi:hypothetical protein